MKSKYWARALFGLAIFALLLVLIYAEKDYNKSKENKELAATELVSATTQDTTPGDHAFPQTSKFDISALDNWDGEPIGTIRMMGGWYHAPNEIETEDGNLWALNTASINEYEFLLVWFDDMGTPETEDDQVIKVWTEVYD